MQVSANTHEHMTHMQGCTHMQACTHTQLHGLYFEGSDIICIISCVTVKFGLNITLFA